jgi:hypothetical protein
MHKGLKKQREKKRKKKNEGDSEGELKKTDPSGTTPPTPKMTQPKILQQAC